MLSIKNKQFIDFESPEFEEGRLAENFFNFHFIIAVDRDPYTLRFHAYCIVINNSFVDEEVNVGTMSRDEVGKFV